MSWHFASFISTATLAAVCLLIHSDASAQSRPSGNVQKPGMSQRSNSPRKASGVSERSNMPAENSIPGSVESGLNETSSSPISTSSVTVEDLPTSEVVARNLLLEGMGWRSGKNGRIDDVKALQYTWRAASMGDPVAKLAYACLADETTTFSQASNEAFEVFPAVVKAARSGDTVAAYYSGLAFSKPVASHASNAKKFCLEYFQIGADGGEILSLSALAGLMADEANATTASLAHAAVLLEKSMALGCKRAGANLGRLYLREGRTSDGLVLLAKAADEGDSNAANDLGMVHAAGVDGVLSPDLEQSCKWWSYAANTLHNTAAAYNLSLLLRSGQVKPDMPEAIRLLRTAVEGNRPEAMVDWGKILYDGDLGVEKNTTGAKEIWYQAANLGNAAAMYNLSFVMARENGVKTNSQQMKNAVKWMERAAAAKHPEAMYDLGVMFASGFGKDKDTSAALQLFRGVVEIAGALGKEELKNKAAAAVDQLVTADLETSGSISGNEYSAMNAGHTAAGTALALIVLLALLGCGVFFLSRRKH